MTALLHLGRGLDPLVAGDDLELRIGLQDAAGGVQDLGELQITHAKFVIASEAAHEVVLTLGAGITLDHAQDEIVVRFTNRITEALAGTYHYELEIVSAVRGVITPVIGTITFTRSRVQAT